MKTYKATITTTISKVREIEAHNEDEAREIAKAFADELPNDADYETDVELEPTRSATKKTENGYPVKATKIAARIVAEVINEQCENNWCIYFDEIENTYPCLEGTGWSEDKAFLESIVEELFRYPQFEDNPEGVQLDEEDGCFDCCSWTNYIACEYDAN